jgi:hypothetical protein
MKQVKEATMLDECNLLQTPAKTEAHDTNKNGIPPQGF